MNPFKIDDVACTIVVEYRNVSHEVAGCRILSNFSLTVWEGETVVLLGRSGCGKTTALKMVNRLLEPTAGVVNVEGRPTTSWDPISLRRKIGYVIQEIGLFPHFTVERNIGLVPSLESWGEEEIQQRVWELLEFMGLNREEFLGRYPSQLSGGQRQRVGVARALAADPPILLMDEPFGALDPLTRSEIQEEFKHLQQHLKKTILFVTHDLREALRLADRIAFVGDGRVLTVETPEQILSSPKPEIEVFLRSVGLGD